MLVMRILIIDDTSDYRKLLRKYIESSYKEAEVTEYDPVSNGFSYNNLDISHYDLVFLDYDLGLADKDGLTYLKFLKNETNVPPIIMLTGANSTQVAVKSLKLGAIDFLLKQETNENIISAKISEAIEFTNIKQELQPVESERTLPDIHSEADQEKPEKVYNTISDVLFTEEGTTPEAGDEIIVPGYEIDREIGRGGMSTVLLARRLEDGENVVLKVLFTDGHEDPLALKRFMQEYTLISVLENRHIINIYERAFASNFAYIAMEHFPSGDLSNRIKSGINETKAVEYLKQMAIGLQAVHDINVVHRDLKPGNILFREDDSLTITDFGAAKNISGDFEDITINNMVVGTPYYMSPEQATGMKIDKRSDIYSLGVMFFQMLTGKRPFTANTISQLIYSHLHDPTPSLPEPLAKYQPLIDGMMAKDPGERFQDANDIITGLDWL